MMIGTEDGLSPMAMIIGGIIFIVCGILISIIGYLYIAEGIKQLKP